MLALAVVVSGSGSNLQAIIDASARPGFGAEVVVVIADRPEITALRRAARAGIPAEVVAFDDFPDRRAFTEAICDVADKHRAGALILAGFMRILDPVALERFPSAILNIHPSLLPAFPGAGAVERALAHGVKLTGVTVHFVDEEVDHGPIAAQAAVSLVEDDTASSLHARIQAEEHRLYPEVIEALAAGRLRIEGRMVRWD